MAKKPRDPEFRYVAVFAKGFGLHHSYAVGFMKPTNLLPEDTHHHHDIRKGWRAKDLNEHFASQPDKLSALVERIARLTGRSTALVRAEFLGFLENGSVQSLEVVDSTEPAEPEISSEQSPSHSAGQQANEQRIAKAVTAAVAAATVKFIEVLSTNLADPADGQQ